LAEVENSSGVNMQTHSKSEVAVVALLRATQCYQNADWISATILAGAAQQVFRDLCEARGIGTTIDMVSASLGHRTSDVHNLVVGSYNGMKHADRDPTRPVSVSPAEPQALIVMAATDMARLNIPYSSAIGEILRFAKSFKPEKLSWEN
jgi:hypothetical protein